VTAEVFIGDKFVLKRFFAKDSSLYGKMSQLDVYKNFVKDDFAANQILSSEVYIKLVYISLENGALTLYQDDKAEEVCQLMHNLKGYSTLTQSLLESAPINFYELGKKSAMAQQDFTNKFKGRFAEQEKLGLKALVKIGLEDLRYFGTVISGAGVRDEVNQVINILSNFVDVRSDYFDSDKEPIFYTIDNHADNIYIKEDVISFLDMYLANPHWIPTSIYNGVAKVCADILAITGNARDMEEFKNGYFEYYKFENVDQNILNFYICYYAYIKRLFTYTYAQRELSDLYKKQTDLLLTRIL
jgi:aminoglycoside phosphotransferase family enzyme